MQHHVVKTLEQMAAERWSWQGVRTLLRSAYLSASIWCIILGGRLLWGWAVPLRLLVAASLVPVAVGLMIVVLRRRLPAHEAARRLDRRFRLREQLSTAVEVSDRDPQPDGVGLLLVSQAAETAAALRRRVQQQQRFPWGDLVGLLALALVAAGLAVMTGIGRPNFAGSPEPLPPLAAADNPLEQLPPEPEAQQPGAAPADAGGSEAQQGQGADQQQSAADPRSLEALADALRDQGITRPAAEALDRGDVAGAADRLREVADQADSLSEEARQGLAEDLRQAAEELAGRDQELAEQLRRSADGLDAGGEQASEALEDLAQAVEQMAGSDERTAQAPGGEQGQQGQEGGEQGQQGQEGGEQGQQGQEGGEQGQQGQQGGSGGAPSDVAGEQRQEDSMERLGVEGQPLPLEAEGEGSVKAEPSDRSPTSGRAESGAVRGGEGGGGQVETGADPLSVPLDERDVVQDYFTP